MYIEVYVQDLMLKSSVDIFRDFTYKTILYKVCM